MQHAAFLCLALQALSSLGFRVQEVIVTLIPLLKIPCDRN